MNRVAKSLGHPSETAGVGCIELGAPDRDLTVGISESHFDKSILWRRALACPPEVVRDAFASSLGIAVLTDGPSEAKLNSVKDRALAHTIPAVDDRKSITEVDPEPLAIAAESAEIHVGDLHGASSSLALGLRQPLPRLTRMPRRHEREAWLFADGSPRECRPPRGGARIAVEATAIVLPARRRCWRCRRVRSFGCQSGLPQSLRALPIRHSPRSRPPTAPSMRSTPSSLHGVGRTGGS